MKKEKKIKIEIISVSTEGKSEREINEQLKEELNDYIPPEARILLIEPLSPFIYYNPHDPGYFDPGYREYRVIYETEKRNE